MNERMERSRLLYVKLFAHYSWILSGFDTNWKPKMGYEISKSHLFAQLHYLNGLGLIPMFMIQGVREYGALIWKKVELSRVSTCYLMAHNTFRLVLLDIGFSSSHFFLSVRDHCLH